MSRHLFAIAVALAFVFTICMPVYAKKASPVGAVPIPVDSVKYEALKQPVFEVSQLINSEGVDIYVVTEDFGLLNIESDVYLEHPIQQEEKSENRDMLLDFGFEAAHYIIPKLYGINTHELHVGNVYIGTPSMAPEGSIVLADVRFVRDGLLYRGRIGILSTEMKSNDADKQMWFVYPLTR